jgi:hypothetical protein
VSLELLHRLAQEQLPVGVTSGEAIDKLRVLRLAGHVEAEIPHPLRTLAGYDQPPATVTAITAIGRRMLKLFPRP